MTVGIVGLGLAGLRAAQLLEAANVTVRLFEAKGRAGGRLWTVDEGEGVLYEAGGEWIDADHYRLLELMESLGIEVATKGAWPKRLFHRAKEAREDLIWNDALEDDLRVEAAAREMCRDLRQPPWSNTHLAELDERRLEDFLREHTQSERGLWWVGAQVRSDEGDDPDQIGLLGWLNGYLHYLDRDGDIMSAFRFMNGSQELIERIIGGLHAEAEYNRPLRRVRQTPQGVTLSFEDGDEKVDRALLTLPPPCLERIVFEPALSSFKRCAIEACRMSRAIKICWQFEHAWWRDTEWAGAMQCDGPLQQTWDASLGEAPVLSAYICGAQAMQWLELGDPVRAGIYELGRMFPEAPRHYRRGWIHDWVHDPFARGAFSHTAPGYVLGHMEHIAPPEGRVFFAGEHTATWTGFMEGALESAERAVAEILA